MDYILYQKSVILNLKKLTKITVRSRRTIGNIVTSLSIIGNIQKSAMLEINNTKGTFTKQSKPTSITCFFWDLCIRNIIFQGY